MKFKRNLSHKSLWNAIYLLGHCKKSVDYLDHDDCSRKMLNYLVNFFEILQKFSDVYFNYTLNNDIKRFCHNVPLEIKHVCTFIDSIVKFIKIRISVQLKDDLRANDILANICRKAVPKLQRYLIHVDYFNKEMMHKCSYDEC